MLGEGHIVLDSFREGHNFLAKSLGRIKFFKLLMWTNIRAAPLPLPIYSDWSLTHHATKIPFVNQDAAVWLRKVFYFCQVVVTCLATILSISGAFNWHNEIVGATCFANCKTCLTKKIAARNWELYSYMKRPFKDVHWWTNEFCKMTYKGVFTVRNDSKTKLDSPSVMRFRITNRRNGGCTQ